MLPIFLTIFWGITFAKNGFFCCISRCFLQGEMLPILLSQAIWPWIQGQTTQGLVAHDCGYPLSRYTCRATRVAADFLDFIAFCRCSTGVALHPLKILVSHLAPPPCPGRCRTEIWVWKGVALHGGVAATVAGVALLLQQNNSCRRKFKYCVPLGTKILPTKLLLQTNCCR